MQNSALLLVDLQNDFCHGGALAVPQGDAVIPVANRLIDWFSARGYPVLASQDWHPPRHGSFASQQGCAPFSQGELDGLAQTFWPDHCIAHTTGAALHPALASQAISERFYKGEYPQVDSYSAFFDNGQRQQTRLHPWLTQRQISSLVIMGLATDYCVKFTVLDALRLGYVVTVITEGCRGVDLAAGDSERALDEMRQAGARLHSLASFCRLLPATGEAE